MSTRSFALRRGSDGHAEKPQEPVGHPEAEFGEGSGLPEEPEHGPIPRVRGPESPGDAREDERPDRNGDAALGAQGRLRRGQQPEGGAPRRAAPLTTAPADTALPATVQDVVGVSYNDGAAGAHNFPVDLISRTDYQTWMERDAGANTPAGQLAYPDLDVSTGITTLRFWPPATVTGPIANLKVNVAGYLPALAGSNPPNALLRDAPDLYLFGALAESAPYLQHDERVPMWEARLSAGVKALRVSTERRLYGGAPRRREFARVF